MAHAATARVLCATCGTDKAVNGGHESTSQSTSGGARRAISSATEKSNIKRQNRANVAVACCPKSDVKRQESKANVESQITRLSANTVGVADAVRQPQILDPRLWILGRD
eukprot:247906-Rhodomonas_salina.1